MNEHGATAAARTSEFQKLLVHLDSDPNRAGEKYENLRRTLLKFFEWNSCFPAEDLADETLDRLGRKLNAEKVHNLSALAWGIARNVRLEAYKRSARLVQISDLSSKAIPAWGTGLENVIQQKMDRGRRAECLHHCLQRLTAEERELFLRYHNAGTDSVVERQHLAGEFGLTISALRVRINRMREKLEKCVGGCMER